MCWAQPSWPLRYPSAGYPEWKRRLPWPRGRGGGETGRMSVAPQLSQWAFVSLGLPPPVPRAAGWSSPPEDPSFHVEASLCAYLGVGAVLGPSHAGFQPCQVGGPESWRQPILNQLKGKISVPVPIPCLEPPPGNSMWKPGEQILCPEPPREGRGGCCGHPSCEDARGPGAGLRGTMSPTGSLRDRGKRER